MKHRDLARAVSKFGDAFQDLGSTGSHLAHDFEMMAAMSHDTNRRIAQLEAIETPFEGLDDVINTNPADGCLYCGNPSNLRDRRGMCVSCGGPYG